MAKERDRIELKPVDEESEEARRYLRLHPGTVEEVEELPPVRIDAAPGTGNWQDPERVKKRSNEPDIGSLIERGEIGFEGQWDIPARAKKLPWGWAALVACVFAAAILWSLWSVNRSEKAQELLVDRTVRIVEDAQQEEQEAEGMIASIEAGVNDFFGSKSLEEMLRFVRQPERVAPLMEDHYGEKPPVPGKLEKILGLAPVTVGNRASFWIASCELGDGETVQVLVEAVGPDEAKVDWETFVNHQPMPWDDFARSRPGGYTGDFRVFVEPDNFYSHEFSDSGTFTSFRLTSLKGGEALSGYVPRGEALEKEITDLIMRNGGGATAMILRLFVPENIQSKRGVVVVELVAPRWVYMDDPEKVGP